MGTLQAHCSPAGVHTHILNGISAASDYMYFIFLLLLTDSFWRVITVLPPPKMSRSRQSETQPSHLPRTSHFSKTTKNGNLAISRLGESSQSSSKDSVSQESPDIPRDNSSQTTWDGLPRPQAEDEVGVFHWRGLFNQLCSCNFRGEVHLRR